MQEGIAFLPIQPFPEPEQPKTTAQDDETGWIKETRRDPSTTREPDWNFRAIIDGQSEKEATACAWYEYSRECSKIRAVASTYALHYRLASGMGRRGRYGENKDRWAKERAANREKRQAMARRLFATLQRLLDGLKKDGLHRFAETFGRKWWQKINDIEGHDPTPSIDWVSDCAWMRIGRLKDRVAGHCEKLNEKHTPKKAAVFKARWHPKLEKMQKAERAWSEAEGWMGKIEGKCSIGAPCLRTLSSWLNDDCPWQDIRDAKEPGLDVKGIAIERGPKSDDSFSKVGKGKHPIAGLSGGLQLQAGFETAAPRSVFWNNTGRNGELLSDDSCWTKAIHFKNFRSETFVGKIVWNRPDSEIMESFEKWLKWRRSLQPEPFCHMGKRQSRSRWDDPAAALSDLAALRLRAGYGATAGSAEWAKIYSPEDFDKRLNNGSIERQARRAAADAVARFNEWMPGWILDSDSKNR